MGVKTAEVLIQEGVRLAGREYDVDDTRPLSDLIDWLSSVALGWPWPECNGFVIAELTAGQYSLTLGGTSSNANGKHIHRLMFPLKLSYGTDFLPHDIQQTAIIDADLNSNNILTGVPDRASYIRDYNVPGRLTVIFDKKAKITYNIQLNYQWNPAASLVVADVPWYPNDLTIKQAVAYYTAKHHDGVAAEKTLKLEDDLSIMVKNDKLKFGVIDSFVVKMNRNSRGR